MTKKPNDVAVIAIGDKVVVLQHKRNETRDGAMARAEALAHELYPEPLEAA